MAVFEALKPGGIYPVLNHTATRGAPALPALQWAAYRLITSERRAAWLAGRL